MASYIKKKIYLNRKQKLEKSSKFSGKKNMMEKKECLEVICKTQRNQSLQLLRSVFL